MAKYENYEKLVSVKSIEKSKKWRKRNYF